MRIIDAVERQPFSISVAEVIKDGVSIDFVPQVREKGYFDVDFRKDKLVLVAGNHVGQSPLSRDIAVHVRPKVPIANLARVIGVASQPIRCLDFFRRKYRLEGDRSATLEEAMARSLVSSLRELDSEGVYREYIQRTRDVMGVRGRVDLPEYLRRSLPRGGSPQIRCRYFELSADTVLNRVIKRAIQELGDAMAHQTHGDRVLLQDLAHYANALDGVPLDHSPTLSTRAREHLQRVHVPVLRHYYLDIIDVCLVILEGSGVELIGKPDEEGMHSFIVNLEDAFELYLRALISREVNLLGQGVEVLDGNTEGKSTLFSDNDKFDAKPDFVIRGAKVVVGEAKYKNKPAESDRYQLISHALSYGAQRAFIVTPVVDLDGETGPEYVGRIGNTNPIEIFHYRFDLASANLPEVESKFVQWTAGLLAP